MISWSRFPGLAVLFVVVLVEQLVTLVVSSYPEPVDSETVRARRVGALMAAFVADAAAMPFHWVYDTSIIATALKTSNLTKTPEFYPSNQYCLFYNYPLGEFTPFGEQMAIYAHALDSAQSADAESIIEAYNAYYTTPFNTTRPFTSYVDNATRGFLENFAAGKRYPHTGAGDTETNAVAHVLPVVAMRAGREHFLEDAEKAIRIVQDNENAVAFGMTFARILEQVVLGRSVVHAIHNVSRILAADTAGNPNNRWFAYALNRMDEWKTRPPFDVTLEIGQACDFPFHVLTAPHFLLHGAQLSVPYTFSDAIRETIKIGGENANRGSFIGSLLAAESASAKNPTQAIPITWQEQTNRYKEMRLVVENIVDGGKATDTTNKFVSASRNQAISSRKELYDELYAPSWKYINKSSTDVSLRGPGLGNAPGCIAHGNSTTSNATQPPSHPDDVAGLRALYLSTGGPTSWLRNGCWLNESVPVCWWDQVLCDPVTWRVRELRLSSNVLTGTLPSALGLLSHLEHLQVTFNRGLTGTLPSSIGNLSMLQWLYAWNASLSSVPSTIGSLQRLERIDMMDNNIAGAIPDSLMHLTNVNTAYFDGNSHLACPLSPTIDRWLDDVHYHADPCPHI